ncbi:ATP-binding protein [uncultured Maricaulis sp.]|uniref:ATP-binding protein n=1 Tax=uncultured Maricaulis sp. TaxID=174710 RepID=UPI00262EB4EA|nr:ATP-binding protein [uncultured Maricaulis sp.]
MVGLVRDVLVDAPAVATDTTGGEVYEHFSEDPDLLVMAVVTEGKPVGLVARDQFFLRMADRHGRALFERRPITFAMNKSPLIVETRTPISELNAQILKDRPAALMDGFIATRNGEYAGVGTTLELFRVMARENADKNHRLSNLAEQLGRARIEALAASKAKSDFLATMSHEIRTPLNGVLGVTQLLQATALDEEQRDFVRVIDESGNILLRLLNDILDLSKIEAGKMELELRAFRPSALVHDTRTLWLGRAREKAIAFEIEADCDHDAHFEGDIVRIKQVLFNLISNAIKFTEDGHVDVRLHFLPIGRRRHVMRVEIKDTGCGIPEAAQGELFSAFKQADAATNRLHGGTGLGLAICRRLVELMSGSIGFESTAGQGSRFWFDLPLRSVEAEAAPAAVAPAIAPVAPVPTQAHTILVAEDNPVNQAVARGFLKLRGLEADYVENGQAAVEAVKTRHYDLVLMDMEMPVMDGLAACRAIRKLDTPACTVPIVALTANAIGSAKDRCQEAGMDDFITKPIMRADLERVLDAYLDPARRAARSRAA